MTGRSRHKAEQVLLLVRLAADTGARRGELAALQLTDLDGDVLTIARAVSAEVVGAPRSGRICRLTLGCGTAALWRQTVEVWQARAVRWWGRGCSQPTRCTTAGCRARAWVTGSPSWPRRPVTDVTLHRLRHTLATVLVGQGDVLAAQARLGHRDASPRYASAATPCPFATLTPPPGSASRTGDDTSARLGQRVLAR